MTLQTFMKNPQRSKIAVGEDLKASSPPTCTRDHGNQLAIDGGNYADTHLPSLYSSSFELQLANQGPHYETKMA